MRPAFAALNAVSLCVLLAVASCEAPAPETGQSAVVQDDSIDTDRGITFQDLASLTYSVRVLGDRDSIQLNDGSYVAELDGMKVEVFLIGADGKALTPSSILHADLDGDGGDEVVLIVHSWLGGTGQFYSLAVVGADRDPGGRAARPHEVASHPLGDRVQIDSVRIVSDAGGPVIQLALWTHGPEDPACCATYESVWYFRTFPLAGGKLDLQLVRDTVLRRDSTRQG